MIGQIEEIKAARQAVDRARRELAEEGCECPAPAIGAMLEVRRRCFPFPHYRVMRLLLDRHQRPRPVPACGGQEQSQRGAPVQPSGSSVIRAVYGAIREARRCGKPVSVCGEMAADPGSAILFLAWSGTFSMSASALLRIKW